MKSNRIGSMTYSPETYPTSLFVVNLQSSLLQVQREIGNSASAVLEQTLKSVASLLFHLGASFPSSEEKVLPLPAKFLLKYSSIVKEVRGSLSRPPMNLSDETIGCSTFPHQVLQQPCFVFHRLYKSWKR